MSKQISNPPPPEGIVRPKPPMGPPEAPIKTIIIIKESK